MDPYLAILLKLGHAFPQKLILMILASFLVGEVHVSSTLLTDL